MVLGIILTLLLLFIAAMFWQFFVSGIGYDSASHTSFDRVAKLILEMEKEDITEPRFESIQIDDELVLIAFSKTDTSVNCDNINADRPNKNCEGSCICICDVDEGSNMCNLEKSLCVDYGVKTKINLVGCNVIEGESEPKQIKIERQKGYGGDSEFTFSLSQ